jgi:hypothetical protein
MSLFDKFKEQAKAYLIEKKYKEALGKYREALNFI